MPEPPELGEREVHVWRAGLDLPRWTLTQLTTTLSQEESERAARFATDRLRDRYVVARGILRTLLAHYLESAPSGIEFRYGEHGKPHLAGEDGDGDLEFNMSHSRDLALFGFTRGCQIGVDLEWTGRELNQREIATRFFSDSETERLLGLPLDRQVEYFFALWTCKEAFVKAQGAGVSFGLDRFDVELDPGAMTAHIACNRPQENPDSWRVFRFEPGPGYLGAAVVEKVDLDIALFEWQGY